MRITVLPYCAECSPRMSPTSSWLKVQEDTSSISVRLNWWETTGTQVYSQIGHISPGHLKNIRSHSFCWWPLISVFIHALHPSPLNLNLCMNPKRYWKGFIHHARTTWLWKALPLVLRLHCLSNRQKYFSGERGEKLYSGTPKLEDDLERTPPTFAPFWMCQLRARDFGLTNAFLSDQGFVRSWYQTFILKQVQLLQFFLWI